MAIIGIHGKAGVGKDTVGRIIQYVTAKEKYNMSIEEFVLMHNWLVNSNNATWFIKRFSDKLKQIVQILVGTSLDLEVSLFKELELPENWSKISTINNREIVLNYTYRKFLQVLGTDAIRNVVHENAWINALFNDYSKVNDKFPNWIITDVRFQNELEHLELFNAILIKVMGKNDLKDPHPSEKELDNKHFQYIISNVSSIKTLILNVCTILEHENIEVKWIK